MFNFYLDVNSLLLTPAEKANLSKCHSSTSRRSHARVSIVLCRGYRGLWGDTSSLSRPCSMILVMEDPPPIKCLSPGLPSWVCVLEGCPEPWTSEGKTAEKNQLKVRKIDLTSLLPMVRGFPFFQEHRCGGETSRQEACGKTKPLRLWCPGRK